MALAKHLTSFVRVLKEILSEWSEHRMDGLKLYS